MILFEDDDAREPNIPRPGHAEDLLRQAVQMIDAGIAIDASFRWVETARSFVQAAAKRAEDDEAPPPEVQIEVLERRILEMIEEAALALGIEPTGWAWRCDNCGLAIAPGRDFSHDLGADEHCGPVGIAPEHEEAAWRAVLAAIRGRQGSTEPFGFFVVDRDGRADHEALDSPFCATRADAEHFRDLLNRFPPSDGPLGSRQPFRVAPVGPVVDLKPFGWGAVDETGLAMNQLVYRSREALDGRVPDGFEVIQLFYVPPPDRPAEAGEAKVSRTCDACGAPIQGGNCCAACHAGIEANRERRLAEAVEAPAEQPEDVKALMGALKASMGMAPKRGRKR